MKSMQTSSVGAFLSFSKISAWLQVNKRDKNNELKLVI